MELSSIVYSISAIVFFLVFMIIIISYVGYRMKRREESIQNISLYDYQKLRTGTTVIGERKWQ